MYKNGFEKPNLIHSFEQKQDGCTNERRNLDGTQSGLPKRSRLFRIKVEIHIDRRTAKKYIHSDSRPEYVLIESKPSKLYRYKPQINIWLELSKMAA